MAHSPSFDLDGKVALITGAAAGIGRACATALASAGVHVALADRDDELGKETAEQIERAGGSALYVSCDVTSIDRVRAMVASVVDRFGRLDIAVNNAGVFVQGVDEDYAEEHWSRVIAVNLTGTWLCAQAEMLQMKKQCPAGGKIINIASIAAHIACSNGAYDASKAGVVHLTKALAARWGRYNINVNSLSPGYVDTVFGRSRTDDELQRLRELTPLGHAQRLADLHRPLLFFASSASDYVTGQDLIVDGGHTLSTWVQPLERSLPLRRR